jgi:predicted RNA-binding Zn ribbon-like protein
MMATMTPRQPARRQGAEPGLPRLLGERLCLDFANSIEDPRSDDPEDFLNDYGDLVRWGRHVGLLDAGQAEQLRGEAHRDPVAAARVFADAVTLRGAVTRVFVALAGDSAPLPPDLAAIQRAYVAAIGSARLVSEGDGFAWAWDEPDAGVDLASVLWLVAASAVDLLTRGDIGRVKQCGGPEGCDWLFYDTSKNGSRRWCSMEGCGSRAKMRRYNARRRLKQAE